MKVIVVQATNLFQIAADYLGDPLQWINIARYNNLKDPFITDITQVDVPDYDVAASNGIGSQ